MDAVIQLKNVTNRFGNQILHNKLDLAVDKGEIVAVIGGSGSGKSVLLRTILGLHKPAQGSAGLLDKDPYALSEKEKRALYRRIGVVFQDGALFSGLSVLDNVALPMREYTNLSAPDVESLALFKIKMVGLEEDAAYKFPSQLSGGMSRRAALARALALDPEILFLDEPTGPLDPVSAAEFDTLINALQKALGLTVFIITHDLDTMLTLCSRILMLADKKIFAGTVEEMRAFDNPDVKAFFHGARMEHLLSRKAG